MTKGIMICGERRCNWRGPEPAIFTATTLREEIAKAELRGRESMRQESDSLARACNLADVDYETFLKIKAYMPVHPAPKPMTEGDQHDALRADAERYRWIEKNTDCSFGLATFQLDVPHPSYSLSYCIDAAIAGEKT